jgi:hypothetical protein
MQADTSMRFGPNVALVVRWITKQTRLVVLLVAASLVAAVGCHGSTTQPADVPPVDFPMKPASGEHREPSSQARRLAAAVTALSRTPGDPSYRTETAALRALAECIEGFSASSIAADRIRSAAERLMTSHSTDAARVDAVTAALATAGSVLTVRTLGNGGDEHETASLIYEAAVGRIDRSLSLLEQRGRLLAALRAATNLVYLSQSASPPYPVADDVLREWEKPGTFCDAVEQARHRVRALATASSHQARASAADALLAIADVMALDSKTAANTTELANVRLDAFGLRHRSSFKGAQGIKVALARTIDIFAAEWTEAELTPWIRAARRSVDTIDGGFVVFERAAIQDAVRTVLDVIVIHARATKSCPPSSDASAPGSGN